MQKSKKSEDGKQKAQDEIHGQSFHILEFCKHW